MIASTIQLVLSIFIPILAICFSFSKPSWYYRILVLLLAVVLIKTVLYWISGVFGMQMFVMLSIASISIMALILNTRRLINR